MLDTRFERCRANRHVAAARGTEPIHGVKLEVIDRRLGWLFPGVIHIDSLPQRSALARPVEGDDGNSKLSQRKKEVIELLDERIVSAGEDEGAALFALCLDSEARQMSAGIRNFDALVASNIFHSESPVSRKVVIEPVTHVAGRQIELRAMVVRGGVQVTLLGFRLFGDLKPDRVPGIIILDTRCNGTKLFEARR